MRVLEVTHRFRPRAGGVETHVDEIASRLAWMGHDVTVLAADRRRGEARVETVGDVTVRRRMSVRPGGAYHVDPRFLFNGVRAKYDVVHVHNYHSAPAVLAAMGARTRVVFTPHYHGGGSTRLRDMLLAPYSVLGGAALRGADDVIAMTDWEARALADEFGVSPVVVPNGLAYNVARDGHGKDIGAPYALHVGRLERYKGAQFAVAALRHLDEMELVVVGEGPFEDRLIEQAERERVADRVHMAGRVDDDELHELYNGAECTTCLSTKEAFGMTAGESLAHGTPVIATPVRGLERWAGVKGVETAEREPIQVAGAILRASRNGAVNEHPLPSWDEVAAQTEAVLKHG